MAQYFFDIIAGGELVLDEEGMILPDFDAARREASRSLAQLAREECHTEDLHDAIRRCHVQRAYCLTTLGAVSHLSIPHRSAVRLGLFRVSSRETITAAPLEGERRPQSL